MSTPLFLTLALIQAPAAPNTAIAAGTADEFRSLVPATAPVLAPRAVSPAAPLAIRASAIDAWGCVYGSSYYCRHQSAMADGFGQLPIPAADPCPWTGQCVGVFPSGSSFDAGRFVAWQWRWGPAIEFEHTNAGLKAGKVIMETRAREAASRDAARSSVQTPSHSPGYSGGGYSRPAQPSSPRPAASGGAGKGRELL